MRGKGTPDYAFELCAGCCSHVRGGGYFRRVRVIGIRDSHVNKILGAGLRKALSVLSPGDRSILFYMAGGFSYESIGEFLRIKAGTAMTAYSRAVKMVRGILVNAGSVQW